jgi:hypothetical protein
MWTLAYARWAEIDEFHPGKVLAIDVYHSLRASAKTIRRDKWAIVTRRRWPSQRIENPASASDPNESTNTSHFDVSGNADAS